MSSARGSNEDGNAYEQQRLARIASNKKKLDSLNIPSIRDGKPKKRTKRTHNTSAAATQGHNTSVAATQGHNTSAAATQGHNLRTRPQRNHAEKNTNEQIGEDLDCESDGDFLCDNDDLQGQEGVPQKKRKGRGITKLTDIFARTPDMPKIKIIVNEYGQPVGEDVKRFTRAIGCVVRRKLRVGCADWRLVDAAKKYEVWTDIKEIYDIDDTAYVWFLTTCAKKWKEFKSTLKKEYFDEKLSDAVLKARHGDRVTDDDWKFLSNYWKSSTSKDRTKLAKESRSKLGIHHTAGSKSFACSRHELGGRLGRPPRRDELYILTHTRKNGVPSRNAEPVIRKLEEIVQARPELKERTIQEGDAFAAACGEKEPRGRVRVLGLGPTPQDVGTPGLKCYTPTRLQMEVLARKKAETERAALQQRIAELEEIQEERMAHESQNGENISQNGSNLRHHVSPRIEEHDDEGYDNAQIEEEYSDHSDEGGFMLVDRRVVASEAVRNHEGSPASVAPPVQPRQCSLGAAPSALAQARSDAPRRPHDELVGQDVILYAMLRSDLPVAKGTIISTNPNTVLGGEALGKQYCEVIVTTVLKRDAILPRPYLDFEKMIDAHKMAIAWPYKRLKVTKAPQSSQGTAGGRS